MIKNVAQKKTYVINILFVYDYSYYSFTCNRMYTGKINNTGVNCFKVGPLPYFLDYIQGTKSLFVKN